MTTKTVIKSTTAVRRAMPEEHDAWYAANGGMDSAGEFIVFTGTVYVPVLAGEVVTVLRARCSAQIGWNGVLPRPDIGTAGNSDRRPNSRRNASPWA